MILNKTTINKPEADITLDDVREEYNRQCNARGAHYNDNGGHYRGAPGIDFDGIQGFISVAARNQYPTLTNRVIEICGGRNYERNHSSFGEMIYGICEFCDFAVAILAED